VPPFKSASTSQIDFRNAVSAPTPIPNEAAVICDSVPAYCDAAGPSIYQKRQLSIDRRAETHQDPFVMPEIIGVLRTSVVSRIGRRGAHDTPVVTQALDAQRTVRQLAIADGEILSLPVKINVTIRQVEIDGHFQVFSQERIEDRYEKTPAKVDRRAHPDRPGYFLHPPIE
jgi:hypothetical protein